jgi:alpha-amylase/alpha-mannosidase (GH57 family)
VILDGENAWEYYPYNGYYFLSELYDALQHHPFIRTTTFAECVGQLKSGPADNPGFAVESRDLPTIVAGSWVYGTFSTWIGMADKNNAWDLLCAAKTSYDRVIKSGRLTEEEQARATEQLGICEGSDWFWWFGDYNSAISVESFDRLFRINLSNLYQLLKLPVPVELQHVVSTGGGHPEAGGAMRRSSE